MTNLIKNLNKFIDPLKRRVLLMFSRGIIKRVNDDRTFQRVQVSLLNDELRDDVDVLQHYGFSSCPHPDAECAIAFISGSRDHGIVLAIDDRRYRVRGLKEGEVVIYTDEGDQISLQRGNTIEIKTNQLRINAKTKVEINSTMLEVNGDIKTTGNITATGDINDKGSSMSGMRDVYNQHTHPNEGGSPPTSQM